MKNLLKYLIVAIVLLSAQKTVLGMNNFDSEPHFQVLNKSHLFEPVEILTPTVDVDHLPSIASEPLESKRIAWQENVEKFEEFQLKKESRGKKELKTVCCFYSFYRFSEKLEEEVTSFFCPTRNSKIPSKEIRILIGVFRI